MKDDLHNFRMDAGNDEKTCQVAWGSRMEADVKVGTIMLDGYIGYGDCTVSRFMEKFKEFEDDKVKQVEMIVNSGGGSLEEACGIYDLMVSSGLDVTAKIFGIAASAATLIACAAKRVEIGENAQYMIHRPVGYVDGTAAEMEVRAKALAEVEGKVVKVYSGRSGQSEEAIRTMMDNETWMTAEDAVKSGFCDGVIKVEVSGEEGESSDDNTSTDDGSGDDDSKGSGEAEMKVKKKGLLKRMWAEIVGNDEEAEENDDLTNEVEALKKEGAKLNEEIVMLRAELEAAKIIGNKAVTMLKDAESGINRRIQEGVVSEMASGGQNPAELPGGEPAKDDEFSKMSAAERIAWVKNNPEKANRLLRAEQ